MVSLPHFHPTNQRNSCPAIAPSKFTCPFMEAYQEVGKAIEEVGHSHRVMHTVVDGEQ